MAADEYSETTKHNDHGVRPNPGHHSSMIPTIGKVLMNVQGSSGQPIEVDLSGTEGYILGRSDSKSSYVPDVDLAAYQALDKGVSRRHAALVRHSGHLHIIDLSSVNGTFLNGDRLPAETAYPLHVDDQLALGELNLVFTLVNK